MISALESALAGSSEPAFSVDISTLNPNMPEKERATQGKLSPGALLELKRQLLREWIASPVKGERSNAQTAYTKAVLAKLKGQGLSGKAIKSAASAVGWWATTEALADSRTASQLSLRGRLEGVRDQLALAGPAEAARLFAEVEELEDWLVQASAWRASLIQGPGKAIVLGHAPIWVMAEFESILMNEVRKSNPLYGLDSKAVKAKQAEVAKAKAKAAKAAASRLTELDPKWVAAQKAKAAKAKAKAEAEVKIEKTAFVRLDRSNLAKPSLTSGEVEAKVKAAKAAQAKAEIAQAKAEAQAKALAAAKRRVALANRVLVSARVRKDAKAEAKAVEDLEAAKVALESLGKVEAKAEVVVESGDITRARHNLALCEESGNQRGAAIWRAKLKALGAC